MNVTRPKIVSLEHTDAARSKLLVVDWNVGNRCNYRCSYCPKYLHDGTLWQQDAAQAHRFVDAVSEWSSGTGRQVHFQWTGGEPTLWEPLQSSASRAVNLGHTVGIISNATRPRAWWERLGPVWREVTLTYHIEYSDYDKFVSVLNFLTAFCSVHVNFTMLPDRFEETRHIAVRLTEEHRDVTATLKPLLVSFKNELYPYEDEQLDTLKTYRFSTRTAAKQDRTCSRMRVAYEDGTQNTVEASRMVATRANRFLGFSCAAGIELLVVHGNGDLFRANCREGGNLGNICGTFSLPEGPIAICTRHACSCLVDIAVTKRRVEN